MVFGEIVGIVLVAGFPVDTELALVDTVSDPVVAHVHGFGASDFDSVVGNAFRCGVVSLDWGGTWLRMAHFS